MSFGSPATKMVLSSLPRPSGIACAWMIDLDSLDNDAATFLRVSMCYCYLFLDCTHTHTCCKYVSKHVQSLPILNTATIAENSFPPKPSSEVPFLGGGG